MLIHFLDFQLQVTAAEVRINIYRKPTYQPVIILNWSNDPISYKKAAFRSFFRKALNYCTHEEDLSREIEYILKIGL